MEHWASVIRETESLDRDRLVDWQRAELQAQLRHAFEHVPYYRQVFADAGAAPDDIRTTDDLVRLPTLDKPTLRERRDELLATNVSESERYYFTTGGSTGIPVGFYHDLDQPWREWAFMRDQWRRVGYRDRETSVVLRGTVVPGGRLWQRDPLRGALVVSSYHLTDEALPRIVDRIRSVPAAVPAGLSVVRGDRRALPGRGRRAADRRPRRRPLRLGEPLRRPAAPDRAGVRLSRLQLVRAVRGGRPRRRVRALVGAARLPAVRRRRARGRGG